MIRNFILIILKKFSINYIKQKNCFNYFLYEISFSGKFLLLMLLIFNWINLKVGYGQNDSLVEYLKIAARNNPEIIQKYYEYQAALEKIPQIGSLPDPEISFGVFLSPMELVSGNQIADIKLMQMFPWWGTLKAARNEMSLMAKARYEAFREAKFRLFFDLQNTWYEIYKINKNIKLLETYLDLLEKIEKLALIKYQAYQINNVSSINKIDVTGKMDWSGSMQNDNTSAMNMNNNNASMQSMKNSREASMQMTDESMTSTSMKIDLIYINQIQSEKIELIENLLEFKEKFQSLIARFNAYLNRDPLSTVSIPDTLKVDTSLSVNYQFNDSSLINNPMLTMLEYEMESLKAREKMIKRMSYPMIGVGINYSIINKSAMSTSKMNGSDMIMPMATISIPIYQKKYKAMKKELEITNQTIQQSYLSAKNSLITEYFNAVEQFNSSKRKINMYKKQYELANKSLEILITNYTTSDGDLTEILRMWQKALNYQLKLNETIADFYINKARLNQLFSYELPN